jgi:hypothetical protein
MKGFFHSYPKFFETSETTANPRRLNFRYHLIIEQNADLLRGKTIIEIASHDGRWAFAALRGAGAAHVVGVEPRQRLVDNANATLRGYDVPQSQFEFICEDGYIAAENMQRDGRTFDVGMVLGFLYHTARQYEIIYRLAALGCRTLIVDTLVLENVTEPLIRLGMEDTEGESRLFSPGKDVELKGVPSITAVHMMLKAAGYEPRMLVAKIPFPPSNADDYRKGVRFTFVGTR